MKILQINVRYNYGSTGKITKDIHDGLMERGYESVVLYGRIDKTDDENVYKVCNDFYSKLNNLWSRFTGVMYGGCWFSTRNIIKKIREEKPDIVHLQCINGYFVNIYRLLEWLKENKYKTVLTLHAEFMYTANCGYALECNKWLTGCGNCPRRKEETKSVFVDGTEKSFNLMKKAFENFDNLTVVSVSPWIMERAERSPILREKEHITILNGVNTETFKFCEDTEYIRKKFCLKDEKMIFHATACFSDEEGHLKGGDQIIKLAKLCKDEPVHFVVAGRTELTGELPENITVLGNVFDQRELAKLYAAADITILTSKKETFSMVTAESLCCGTPVVGFEAGAPEQIAIKEFSKFVKSGDTAELKKAVFDIIGKNFEKKEISAMAEEKYSENRMVEEYIDLYGRTV